MQDDEKDEPACNRQVGIVILNWNEYNDTATCLRSLSDINYSSYSVYVVDNGSTDDSFTKLKQEFSWCNFIQKKDNTGFASGCNSGILEARSDGCDYVLLLNNDTIVNDNFLSPLVETAESNDTVAAVGGIIYYPGKEQIWFSGGKIYPRAAKIKRDTKLRRSTEYQTDWIISAMMLINVDFLDEYGSLNEDYFFGSEDQELCYYAHKNNWNLYINPKSEVVHKPHSASGSTNGFQFYHNTYNRLYFASNCLKPTDQILFYIYFFFNRVAFLIYFSLTARIGMLKCLLYAVIDYHRGEYRKATEYI